MGTEEMTVGEMLAATVPKVRTRNLEYLEYLKTTSQRAALVLPDQPVVPSAQPSCACRCAFASST